MKLSEMRLMLYRAYPGESWKKKVDTMPDEQVIAIWHKFEKQGKFDKKLKVVKPPIDKKTIGNKKPEYIQMTIFDYL